MKIYDLRRRTKARVFRDMFELGHASIIGNLATEEDLGTCYKKFIIEMQTGPLPVIAAVENNIRLYVEVQLTEVLNEN